MNNWLRIISNIFSMPIIFVIIILNMFMILDATPYLRPGSTSLTLKNQNVFTLSSYSSPSNDDHLLPISVWVIVSAAMLTFIAFVSTIAGGGNNNDNNNEDSDNRPSTAYHKETTGARPSKDRRTTQSDSDDDNNEVPDGEESDYSSDEEDEEDFDPDDNDMINTYDPFSMANREGVIHVEETAPFQPNLQFGTNETRSNSENTVLEEIKQRLRVDVSQPLIKDNQVYIPLSVYERENKFNLTRLQIKNIGKKRGVYFVYEDGKIGRSVDLGRRSREYGNIAGIIMVFDYDYAEKNSIDKVTNVITTIAKMSNVKLNGDNIGNLDYDNINEMERTGLSFFPRLLFHLIANDKADQINSILNGVNLNNVELALSVGFREDYGINVKESSTLGEHLICGLMGWVPDATAETTNMAKLFFESLFPEEYNMLVKNPHIIEAILSWPRGEPLSGPRSIDACKVMIMKIILGVSGRHDSDQYWKDTLQKPPGDGSELYNKGNYKPEDLDEALIVLETLIDAVEKAGGIRALDVNELIMSHIKTDMIAWLEQRGWKPFFSALDMVVLRFPNGPDDGEPRMLFVNRPVCWTLFSGVYKQADGSTREMNDDDAKSQARRGKTTYLMQMIFQVIRSTNEDLVLKPCTSIQGNILIAFLFRMYLLKNIHAFRMSATLLAKYILMMEHRNVLDEDCHGLLASKHGTNIKEQQESQRGEVAFTKDMQLQDKVLRLLSRIRPDSNDDFKTEIFDGIVDLFNVIISKGDTDERERRFDNQTLVLQSFRKDYLNENGEDVYQMMSNRVTTFYAGDVGSSRQAVVDAAVADAPSDADRELAKQTLRSSMAGFTL